MQTLNIAGYQFINLVDLPELQGLLKEQCQALSLKGTILLSSEGINLNLAGTVQDIHLFKIFLQKDSRFAEMNFRESFSTSQPYNRLKVKIKKEIITMRRPEVKPDQKQAPSLSPQEFKQWLDENRDISILDTRNDYEVRFGTFRDAINLNIQDFCEFPAAAERVDKDKPIVMFCTGGIRCEKAALHMLNAGYSEVYQLQGGILNYFAEMGGAHYDGECFVFDQRVSVDSDLQITGTQQCKDCQGPIKPITDNTCPTCLNN